MVKVETVYFDFRVEEEVFAHRLYGEWDHFYRTSFEKVAEEVCARYDVAGELLVFETITLELGNLTETEFYEKFPLRLTDCLEAFFRNYLLSEDGRKRLAETVRTDGRVVGWLIGYLLEGHLNWEIPDEYRNLSYLLEKAVGEKGGELAFSLRRYGEREIMRKRLVLQFADRELERIVAVTEPSQHLFINGYVRFLRGMYRVWKHPEMTAGNYREVVWMLVFAYLLYEGKDFFSRKQFVYRTVAGLAAHYNIGFTELLARLVRRVEELMERQAVAPELLRILVGIQREQQLGKAEDEIPVLRELAAGKPEAVPEEKMVKIRFLLSGTETCRKLLEGLEEEKIYRLVRLVVPEESDFIISYARLLEQEKRKGMFEGKAGTEFRLLKWEFMFRLLTNDPGSLSERKRFVFSVLQQLGAHYHLEVTALVEFFRQEAAEFPDWLSVILQALYRETMEEAPLHLMEEAAQRKLEREEIAGLRCALSHPLSCRTLLSRLTEVQICRLAETVCPAESGFMVAYARVLDREKEQGMLEGKAGTDFRVVKWAFIFLTALYSPFDRKRFVYTVLQQLAAHYNQDTGDLLEFFCRNFGTDNFPVPVWLSGILEELQTEFIAAGRLRKRTFLPDGEMSRLFPEPVLELRERQYRQSIVLEDFVRTGKEPAIGLYRAEADVYTIFVRLQEEIPEVVRTVAECFKRTYRPLSVADTPVNRRFYAAFLLRVIRYYGLCFSGSRFLISFAKAAEDGRSAVPAGIWRQLAYHGLSGERERFQALSKLLSGREEDFSGNPVSASGSEDVENRESGRKGPANRAVVFPGEAEGSERGLPRKAAHRLPGNEDCFAVPESRKEERKNGEQADLSLFTGAVPAERKEEAVRLIQNCSGALREFWYQGKPDEREAFAFLAGDRFLQALWLRSVGSAVLRMVADELLTLCRRPDSCLNEGICMQWLVELTARKNADFSRRELLKCLWKKIRDFLPGEEFGLLRETVSGFAGCLPEWKSALAETEGEDSFFPEGRMAVEERDGIRFYIRNAGLVLLSPWLPRLFEQAGLLREKKEFIGEESRVKAVFMLQYLLSGEGNFAEYELILNKLLTGSVLQNPLPGKLKLKEGERRMLDGMLAGVKGHWEKMKNTDTEGFRRSFLMREGVLVEREEYWHLRVESRPYDVLLDTLPWSYTPVKYRWMGKPILVDWR